MCNTSICTGISSSMVLTEALPLLNTVQQETVTCDYWPLAALKQTSDDYKIPHKHLLPSHRVLHQTAKKENKQNKKSLRGLFYQIVAVLDSESHIMFLPKINIVPSVASLLRRLLSAVNNSRNNKAALYTSII